jgi:hypothetical protein
VFSIHPGMVRAAMAQSILDSPEGQRWLDWVLGALEQWDTPPDRTLSSSSCRR